MANRYLVSFCNNRDRLRLAVATPAGVERVVDLGDNLLPFTPGGITGMAWHQDRLSLVLQGRDAAMIAAFDCGFTLKAELKITDASDLHGLLPSNSGFLVVSTGTNELFAIGADGKVLEIVWSDGGPRADRDHLNDLCRTADGAVLMSRFGPRRPDGMRSGSVIEAAGGRALLDGLCEPHSVCSWDGQLYVLESALGDLVRARPGASPERVVGIAGYARGLAIDDEYIVIGRSGYREISRNTLGDSRRAPLEPPGDGAGRAGYSGLCFIAQRDNATSWVDTTAVGAEIYQVMPLPD